MVAEVIEMGMISQGQRDSKEGAQRTRLWM